jgi:hypothetical protein
MLSVSTCERVCPANRGTITGTQIFAPQNSSEDEIVTPAEEDLVVGELFNSKSAMYVVAGTAVGILQPYVVGKLLKGDSATAVNVVTGIAAIGVGVAGRAGYIKQIPEDANSALIAYGVTVLIMTLIGEAIKRWG